MENRGALAREQLRATFEVVCAPCSGHTHVCMLAQLTSFHPIAREPVERSFGTKVRQWVKTGDVINHPLVHHVWDTCTELI